MSKSLVFQLFLALSFGGFVAAETVGSKNAWEQGWPSSCGPLFNFAALDTGVELVAQLENARIVWWSESPISRAKGFSAIDNSVGSSGIPSGGGYAPILAEGRLLQWHYVPSGETARWRSGRAQTYTRVVTPSADMHLLAIDPADGKTLWRRIIPGVAPNFQGDKSVDPQNRTPCAADGRVFCWGRDDRLYAFRIQDGALLWSRPVGDFVHAQNDRVSDLMQSALYDPHVHHRGDDILMVAAGRVLLNQGNLVAYDAETGEEVWRKDVKLDGGGFPLPWVVGDRTRLLVSSDDGLHCLDAETGESFWQEISIPRQERLYIDGDRLLIQMHRALPVYSSRFGGVCDFGTGAGTPAVYRINEEGAELLWAAADAFDGTPESVIGVRNSLDSLANIHDGKAYMLGMPVRGGLRYNKGTIPEFALQGEAKDGLVAVVHKDERRTEAKQLLVVDLETGKLLHRLPVETATQDLTFARIGDYLLAETDTGHENKPLV